MYSHESSWVVVCKEGKKQIRAQIFYSIFLFLLFLCSRQKQEFLCVLRYVLVSQRRDIFLSQSGITTAFHLKLLEV